MKRGAAERRDDHALRWELTFAMNLIEMAGLEDGNFRQLHRGRAALAVKANIGKPSVEKNRFHSQYLNKTRI